MTVVQLKLLLSGDVELNPGPPKRGAPKGAPPKEKEAPPPQDNNLGALETKVYFPLFEFLTFLNKLYFNLLMLECTKL